MRERCIARGKLKNIDVISVPFDISDVSIQEEKLSQVLNHFRCIDVLVNNAGRSLRAMTHETNIAVDQEIFKVNVFGVINLSRLILNHWYNTKWKGHFVVTSSTTGKMGVINAGAYSASKHALHGYFETLRQEAYSQGIRVTMACPGPVFSQAAQRAFTGVPGELFEESHTDNLRRMKTSRCARLIAIALVNEIDEAWICFQPILLMYYANQYIPSIFRWLLPKIMTKERVAKYREGR